MLKPHILFDHTKTSKKIKNFLDHKIKNISLGKCNLIIVVGGDGFMLSSLKKYNKYKKPFYGINAGSYGFLMNKFSSKTIIKNMVLLAELTRHGFINGDISTLMSPRTVLSWAQNYLIFNDLLDSFSLTFLNKCDDLEKPIVVEYFQRCFEEKNDS